MTVAKKLIVFASLFLASCLMAELVFAECPDCYIDHKAMKSYGTSANGRPIVRVKLTGSWDVTPGHSDSRMFSAVRDAVRDWNNAADPATGRGAFYQYDFSDQTQSADDNDVNIRIVKAPPEYKGPAYLSGPAGGPYNVNLPANSADKCTPAALLERVKHEIAHPMGLAHMEVRSGKCRQPVASMMDAPTNSSVPCPQMGREIQPRDIQVSINVDDPAFRQGNCKSRGEGLGGPTDFITPPEPTPTPTGGSYGCHTYQDFDSFYVGEGCWHDYWTIMIICDGYVTYFSQADLDVHCY